MAQDTEAAPHPQSTTAATKRSSQHYSRSSRVLPAIPYALSKSQKQGDVSRSNQPDRTAPSAISPDRQQTNTNPDNAEYQQDQVFNRNVDGTKSEVGKSESRLSPQNDVRSEEPSTATLPTQLPNGQIHSLDDPVNNSPPQVDRATSNDRTPNENIFSTGSDDGNLHTRDVSEQDIQTAPRSAAQDQMLSRAAVPNLQDQGAQYDPHMHQIASSASIKQFAHCEAVRSNRNSSREIHGEFSESRPAAYSHLHYIPYSSLPGESGELWPTSGFHDISFQNPVPSSHPFQHPMNSMETNGFINEHNMTLKRDLGASIGEYICGQFGHNEFADNMLNISHLGSFFHPFILPAHNLLLARSPRLRSLMAHQPRWHASRDYAASSLIVQISDRFLGDPLALIVALRLLYGDALPDELEVCRLTDTFMNPNSDTPLIRMSFILALTAAGHFLQIDEITEHGVFLASRLLDWTTLGKALVFAIDGGISPAFSLSRSPAIQEFGSSSSSEPNAITSESPYSAPTYGVQSERLLGVIIDFIVNHIPVGFELITAVSQLDECPRLPLAAEPRHSRSSSVLSQIQFGEMNSHGHQVHASSALISLPYQVLKYVLESSVLAQRLGWDAVKQLAQDVVAEREKRRVTALNERGPPTSSTAMEDSLWQTTFWSETVQSSNQAHLGIKLSRRIITAEEPSTSPTGP